MYSSKSATTLGPIHTHPFLLENANFCLRIAFPSPRIRRIRSSKTELFKTIYVMLWYIVREI